MDEKKIKICLLSDSPTHTTGNAKVAREMMKGLSDKGYDMYSMAVGYGDLPEKDMGHYKLLPIQHENYSENSVAMFLSKVSQYIERDKYDYLIVLGDEIYYTYLGLGNLDKEFLNECGTKIIPWITVDSNMRLCMESAYKHPSNPKLMLYSPASHIISASHYGKNVLENDFLKVDKVIWPHVDTETFAPVTKEEKIKLRKKYRFGKDDFIFLTVARNTRRKNNELAIESVYQLMIDNPHIRWFGIIPGYNESDENNLIDFVKNKLAFKYGGRDLISEKRILFANTNKKALKLATSQITDEEIIEFYKLSDVTISGSSNEGFGSSYVESIAVGNPFVTLNHTTIPELTDDGKYALVADAVMEICVGQGIMVNCTSLERMAEQTKIAYNLCKSSKFEEYKKGIVNHAKKFDVKRMIREWDEYIEHLEVKH